MVFWQAAFVQTSACCESCAPVPAHAGAARPALARASAPPVITDGSLCELPSRPALGAAVRWPHLICLCGTLMPRAAKPLRRRKAHGAFSIAVCFIPFDEPDDFSAPRSFCAVQAVLLVL